MPATKKKIGKRNEQEKKRKTYKRDIHEVKNILKRIHIEQTNREFK